LVGVVLLIVITVHRRLLRKSFLLVLRPRP
jgi:hypothetical protein